MAEVGKLEDVICNSDMYEKRVLLQRAIDLSICEQSMFACATKASGQRPCDKGHEMVDCGREG